MFVLYAQEVREASMLEAVRKKDYDIGDVCVCLSGYLCLCESVVLVQLSYVIIKLISI